MTRIKNTLPFSFKAKIMAKALCAVLPFFQSLPFTLQYVLSNCSTRAAPIPLLPGFVLFFKAFLLSFVVSCLWRQQASITLAKCWLMWSLVVSVCLTASVSSIVSVIMLPGRVPWWLLGHHANWLCSSATAPFYRLCCALLLKLLTLERPGALLSTHCLMTSCRPCQHPDDKEWQPKPWCGLSFAFSADSPFH